MKHASEAPSAAEVLMAARRLRGVVRRTPLEFSVSLSEAAGVEVWLKLENQQRTGSFKVRGACNAVLALRSEERERGIVTASAGNHGLGVAFAARRCGVAVTVFVPAGAPLTKRSRIARLGASLREVHGSYDDAHLSALSFSRETGARYLHAFSDPAVVAGQATVGLEILQELPFVRTLLVPIGGGGLIGGVGVIARALGTGTQVVGVQSEATAAMHASLLAGRSVSPPPAPTVCDGLAGDIDDWSLTLARRVVDQVLLVTERSVRRSMQRLFIEEGIVAEGSAATVAAALWDSASPALNGPVVAVVSGGNVDAAVFAEILIDR
ncbi:MAG TPA: threonine/serine dehydratase [Longimicrobiaceae bacterium]|nr:threonine/serine dehydratase [Longimicrobiaceae bacterium]